VKGKTVTLGDDLLFSPKKVDSVRPNFCLKLKRRELCRETNTEHLGFKNAFRLLRIKSPTLKNTSESGDSWSALTCVCEKSPPSLRDRQTIFNKKVFEHT